MTNTNKESKSDHTAQEHEDVDVDAMNLFWETIKGTKQSSHDQSVQYTV